MRLERAHRADLLQRQRQDRDPGDHREEDDREAPARPDVVVEELQDRVRHVHQRLEDVCRRNHAGAPGRGLNNVCASTGSQPPWLNGLHRASRQAARRTPRDGP